MEFFAQYGIWILPVCVLLDDLGVIFPSSWILLAATIFAKTHGTYPVYLPCIIAIACSTLGNGALFVWGRHGAKKWLQNNGHKFFLPQKRLKKFEIFFDHHHGAKTIFFVSLINNIRPFMALVAGSSNMPPSKFFPVSILGISIWASTVSVIGYFFGEYALTILQDNIKLFAAVLVTIAGGIYFWKFFPREILPSFFAKKE